MMRVILIAAMLGAIIVVLAFAISFEIPKPADQMAAARTCEARYWNQLAKQTKRPVDFLKTGSPQSRRFQVGVANECYPNGRYFWIDAENRFWVHDANGTRLVIQ